MSSPGGFAGGQQALAGRRVGQAAVVAGHRQRGRGGEVPGAQAPDGVTAAEQRGEEARGESVAGADRLDDLDAQCGHVHGAAGVEGGGAGRGVLDDNDARAWEQAPHIGGPADRGAPQGGRLVKADEHDVGGVGEFAQQAAGRLVPQRGAVVHVEADRRPGPVHRERAVEGGAGQRPAARGERGRDAGQVPQGRRAQRHALQQLRSHRGRGRAAAVVGHAGAAIAQRARRPGVLEHEAGGPGRVEGDAGHVHARGTDGPHDPAAEGVVAEPGHPAGAHAVVGQVHRDIRLGPRDVDPQCGRGFQRFESGGDERRHRLADARRRVPVRSRRARAPGSAEPAARGPQCPGHRSSPTAHR
jgi:hypothetical protein